MSANPDFKLLIGGSAASEEIISAVIQITVDDAVNAASVATIKLQDEDCKVTDLDKFKCGAPIQIDLGYVGATKTVFKGEITGLRASFPRRGNQVLLVIAQDKFHRLRRNRRQKTFLSMKDSAAVEEVAREAGLSAEVEATPIKQDSILQWNQTDADFVLERASLFAYEAFVDDAKLVFRKPKLGDAEVATIEWHQKLRHFATSISLHQQHKQVTVRAWDMLKKAPLEASAGEGDERDLMGGTIPGANAVASVDGAADMAHTTPAATADEVTAYADAQFTKQAERFLLGEGTCDGNPDIRRGTVLKIDAIGPMLSGKYYVHRAIHTLLTGSGYTTTFRVYRPSLLTPSDPPPSYERQESQSQPGEAPPPEPLSFEVAAPGGAPLGGAPFVLVDPDGNRQAGTLSNDGRVDIEFEEQ